MAHFLNQLQADKFSQSSHSTSDFIGELSQISWNNYARQYIEYDYKQGSGSQMRKKRIIFGFFFLEISFDLSYKAMQWIYYGLVD